MKELLMKRYFCKKAGKSQLFMFSSHSHDGFPSLYYNFTSIYSFLIYGTLNKILMKWPWLGFGIEARCHLHSGIRHLSPVLAHSGTGLTGCRTMRHSGKKNVLRRLMGYGTLCTPTLLVVEIYIPFMSVAG
jgi:hypothetical protein